MASRRSASFWAASVLTTAALLVSASGAFSASAAIPTVSTGPATVVGPSTATVTGTVNPNGSATTWYVEYGTGTSYGSKSSSKSVGSGANAVAVAAALSGLAQGTTYHYRVVASNGSGTSRGADGIFTTTVPPGVVTGAATSVTPTSATLAGTVDPNGRATTWYFEYGTSTSYGSKTPAKSAGAGTSAASVSAPVTRLAVGHVYHYRLVATNDAGSTRGADKTFSTTGTPSATTGSTSSITLTAARLKGTVVPNGLTTSWYFEYGTSTSYGSKTPTKSAGSGVKAVNKSASISGLKPATTYHYRLVATNASGTAAGRDRVFSTAGPPLVRTGAAQQVTASAAELTGTVDARGRHTTWYFEYGQSTFYGARTAGRSGGSSFAAKSVAAGIAALRPSTTYHYRLVASNDAGTTRGADATFTTAGVTIAAAAQTAVYGQAVLLSGTVPVKRQGEIVTIYAQEFGQGSPRLIGTVATNAVGAWSFAATPTIMTSYLASWNSGLSQPTVVGVRPAISFRRVRPNRFSTGVLGAHSFARRSVKLQRRTTRGTWITIRRVRLNQRSTATFSARLPRGMSTLRIAMSVNQAGAGYLAGFSRTIRSRRA